MRALICSLVFLSLTIPTFAGTAIVPTTTLSAETGNNTSAAGNFTSQNNGNAGAGNVSEVSVKQLLYPGATTKLYAHLMPWFGGSSHMNVGYASNDPAQVERQVTAMMKRGIDGVIIDWYGRNFFREDQTTLYVKQEAERRGGSFKFAVMEDHGALKRCLKTSGCSVTSEVITDLNYAYSHYMQSAAYLRIDGRPVVFFFGLEKDPIDWTRVRASVLGNPIFVRQNAGGFTALQSNGGYGWVIIDRNDSTDIGSSYLDNFYKSGLANSTKKTVGAVYKGFNDSLAAWHATPPRVMNQNCGQTWLSTWGELSKFYSLSRQLESMQLVTWNDYEEGTALEVGIDNCISVAASTEGSTVKWTLTGRENTVDHFTVFISEDGTSLMRVADVPASSRSLDLRPWGFASGTYTVYVKAIGRPLLRNKISAGVNFTISNVASSSTSSTKTESFGVKIASPLNSSIVPTTMHVSGYASSAYPITAMHVYVDNVKVAAVKASKIDTYIKVATGSRYVVVQAWDASGKIYKSSVTVKAQ